jgi:hypothetical protein
VGQTKELWDPPKIGLYLGTCAICELEVSLKGQLSEVQPFIMQEGLYLDYCVTLLRFGYAFFKEAYTGETSRLHMTLLIGGIIPLLIQSFLEIRSRTEAKKRMILEAAQKAEEQASQKVNDNLHNISVKMDTLMLEFKRIDEKQRERLSTLEKIYLRKIEENNYLSNDENMEQFDSIKTMLQWHANFFVQMKKAVKHLGGYAIWQLLPEYVYNLTSMSATYLANYEENLLARGVILNRNPKFLSFICTTDSSHAESLEMLLASPFEHYKALEVFFSKCVKFVQEANAKVEGWGDEAIIREKCYLPMKQICSYCKETCASFWERAENLTKLLQVMYSFTPATRLNLLDNPSRQLIQEGPLLKQCRKANKLFHYWLFSDKMIYGEASTNILAGRNEYVLNRDIALFSSRINSEFDTSVKDRERAIMLECSEKSFVMWAATSVDALKWKENIQACIEKSRKTFADEFHITAPVWQPDRECHSCQICKTGFGFFTRRHHCRSCGQIICDSCSKHNFLLPHVNKDKPVRACDRCFSVLSNPNSPVNSPAARRGSASKDVINMAMRLHSPATPATLETPSTPSTPTSQSWSPSTPISSAPQGR